jgi:hypothetical protein
VVFDDDILYVGDDGGGISMISKYRFVKRWEIHQNSTKFYCNWITCILRSGRYLYCTSLQRSIYIFDTSMEISIYNSDLSYLQRSGTVLGAVRIEDFMYFVCGRHILRIRLAGGPVIDRPKMGACDVHFSWV